jgi:periplasmic copper chaperone A
MTTWKDPMTHRRIAGATAALALLALPAGAQAHVSLHPNAWPAGSFVTTNVRVPNEMDDANTTTVRLQMPDGVLTASPTVPAGWKAEVKTKKLATPVKTDDGEVTSTVSEVDFTGGSLPPGQTAIFPLTLSVPDSAKEGDTLSFKALQTYSNGQVVRWIGGPDDEHPAPTVDITAKGGPILDVTGGDAGPPAKLPTALEGGGDTASSSGGAPAQAAVAPAATRTVVKEQSKTLSVVALIVGIVGILFGGAALATRRRAA